MRRHLSYTLGIKREGPGGHGSLWNRSTTRGLQQPCCGSDSKPSIQITRTQLCSGNDREGLWRKTRSSRAEPQGRAKRVDGAGDTLTVEWKRPGPCTQVGRKTENWAGGIMPAPCGVPGISRPYSAGKSLEIYMLESEPSMSQVNGTCRWGFRRSLGLEQAVRVGPPGRDEQLYEEVVGRIPTHLLCLACEALAVS